MVWAGSCRCRLFNFQSPTILNLVIVFCDKLFYSLFCNKDLVSRTVSYASQSVLGDPAPHRVFMESIFKSYPSNRQHCNCSRGNNILTLTRSLRSIYIITISHIINFIFIYISKLTVKYTSSGFFCQAFLMGFF